MKKGLIIGALALTGLFTSSIFANPGSLEIINGTYGQKYQGYAFNVQVVDKSNSKIPASGRYLPASTKSHETPVSHLKLNDINLHDNYYVQVSVAGINNTTDTWCAVNPIAWQQSYDQQIVINPQTDLFVQGRC